MASRRWVWFIFGLIVAWLPTCTSQWTPDSFPNPTTDVDECGLGKTGWLCDPDSIMSPTGREQGEAVLQSIELECLHDCQGDKVGYQVAVAVMRSMDLNAVPGSGVLAKAREFSGALGDRWGVGHRGCDDGVLLLVSRRDRVAYIRTASASQQVITDEVAEFIVDQMKPHFKKERFDEGIVGGLLMLKVALSGKEIRPSGAYTTAVILVVAAFVIFWPYLWCVAIGLLNLVLFPIALLLDGATALWHWGNQTPSATSEEQETLRRIQLELEGMNKDKNYEQKMCAVCLEDFPTTLPSEELTAVTGIRLLACGHRFHKECIQQWAESSSSATCPLCREGIGSSGDDETYKARLRHFLARLRAQRPLRSHSTSPSLDADVDYFYRHRCSNWSYRNATRFPFFHPERSYVQTLPSFTEAVSRSHTLAATWRSRGTSGGGRAFGGGGGFRSGGGGGGRW